MAKKAKTHFLCSDCGETYPRWLGKCNSCGAFNTLTEFRVPSQRETRTPSSGINVVNEAKILSDCNASEVERFPTGFPEFDTVLGGGIVAGSMNLLGGSPGIGKSTLMLQVAAYNANKGKRVLYISGEESVEQIAYRAKRLGDSASPLFLMMETSLEVILQTVEKEKPDLLIIDSIQTLHTEEITSAPGSVSQVRECTVLLMSLAKKSGISLVIIGHVTKDGSIAGPRVLEHMVDTVLSFEGERNYSYRILRGMKNRFGPSGEIALFDMVAQGLVEMKDAARYFIMESSRSRPGAALVPLLEGSRVLMVEVQALVTASHFGTPQRVSSGVNPKKIALIIAVLEKYAGITLGDFDIFVNVTGGLNVSEPAVDLAIAAALLSSFRNKAIPVDLSFVGELGLGGEIRPVVDMEKRIREVLAMGFKRVVAPPLVRLSKDVQSHLVVCQEIKQLMDVLI